MKKINLYNLIIEYFSEIEDHRVDRTKKHNMFTIIFVVIFGLACGVKSWIGFADNALLNKDWLLKYLKVDSLPSKDTIARFIRTVDPIKINECFMNLVNDFVSSLKGMTVPIDGKTMSSAFKNAERKNGLHLISAWCTELGLCLGQTKTEEKSNEIEAIPKLIDMIKVKEAVITIDAIGCQTNIIDAISQKKM